MKTILVIEDDLAIRRGLKDNLEHEGYQVIEAGDGEEGYDLIKEKKPDLIVLDLMLPKVNGYEVCRRVRKEGNTVPILMLTARGEEVDRVLGLDMGADDYVTKPFSLPELLARIRALFRRPQQAEAGEFSERITLGNAVIDFKRFETLKDGESLKLTRKEYGILHLLAIREGEVLTRDDLLEEVWGHDSFPTTRTVDNHIGLLRNKLEEDPAHPRYLITVHGVGYRLVLEA